jgi:hypothetical protein
VELYESGNHQDAEEAVEGPEEDHGQYQKLDQSMDSDEHQPDD